jgi:hypothetical protein
MGSAWDDRLRIWDEFLRSREAFKVAAKEHSIKLSELRLLAKRQPQIGEIVTSSSTKESGRIVRIIQNDHVWGKGRDGISYVVAVPAVSPKREELWKDSEILHSARNSLLATHAQPTVED